MRAIDRIMKRAVEVSRHRELVRQCDDCRVVWNPAYMTDGKIDWGKVFPRRVV
jgi:hypothetical protein